MGNFFNELRSFNSIPRELVFDKTLSDRARFVYVYMSCKPEYWEFFLDTMAKEIGYSVDTLRKYINELVASGWIEKGCQKNNNGKFGAVEYILKATKFSDTEKTRHGKNTTQNNNIPNNSNTSIETINIKEINNKKELKEKFAEFVKLYKKLTGKNVRGIETEFNDFSKRHKDWKEVVPYLSLAIRRESKDRAEAKAKHVFFPEPKMLQTYLGKQRAWEMYVTIGEDLSTINSTYTPQGRTIWFNEGTRSYWTDDNFYYGTISDGYDDETRPDGATLTLNNARGDIYWDKKTKKWNKK